MVLWQRLILLPCLLRGYAKTPRNPRDPENHGERTVLGVIGGSGIYDIDGLEQYPLAEGLSPFGAPSDEFLFGTLGGQQLVFLPRHGRGHRISPTQSTTAPISTP